jgi:Heterokaryon incompatibility protein (HET)
VEAVLGGNISDVWERAYQRHYFNRFGSFVFMCLWATTGPIAVYLKFPTWGKAVIALIAGAFQNRLAAYLLRALQWLRFDMTAILVAERTMQIPESGKFRFVWGDLLALSYVWGDPDPATMCDIIVNGRLVMARGNLEAALRRLWGALEAYSGLKLWIDALCINQEDIGERNREVRRMREIHASAWSVLSWLGEEAEESGKAIDLIKYLSVRSASLPDPTGLSDRWAPKYFGI